MRDFRDNSSRSRRVGPRDRLVKLGNAKALNDLLLLLGVTDHAPVILDLDLAACVRFCFLCHDLCLER